MVQGFTKRLKDALGDHGWKFLRNGKGDHEIWHDPLTGRKVVVDGKILSRFTANAVLKQAGIKARF